MRLLKINLTGLVIFAVLNFSACTQGNKRSDMMEAKALQYAKDRAAIEAVLVQYTTGLDTLNADLYANTFTPDAKFYRGEGEDGKAILYKEGRDAIRSIITDMVKRREERAAVAAAQAEAKDKDAESTEGGAGSNDSQAETRQPATPMMHHIMTNAVIDITDENTAHHYSYWMTVIGSGRSFSVAGMGRYDDIIVKRDGRWLIHERKLLR